MKIPRFTLPILLLTLTACALSQASAPQAAPTPTTVRVIQSTPVPTLNRERQPIASPPPAATPTADTCQQTPDAPTTQHIITADLDYTNRSLIVQQRIHYINRTPESLTALEVHIRPNSTTEVFIFDTVSLFPSGAANYELTGQRLTIALPEPLQPGCSQQIELGFKVHVPPIDLSSDNAYQGYLGYSPRQMNLGQWLPVMAVHQDAGWVNNREIPIGEQEVLETADWDVTLTVTHAPDNLRIAAPGAILDNNPGHWHSTLTQARDFSLSLGEGFQMASQHTASGVKIEVYSYDDAILQTDAGPINSAAFALDSAVKSVDMYTDLFGAYPYERLVIVQGDFPDGMEFSGIVFVGGEYFRSFGGPTSYLMLITVHEISHQWWYARVGSDQARYPWLDEALATYSECVFIEEFYPGLKEWWWEFRVERFAPEGFVDETVYDFNSRRAYINAVYLRGVQMLHDLRDNLGTEVFFGWLRRYADAGAGQLMTPDDLWGLLTPAQFQQTAITRQSYLKTPQITLSATQTSS